MRKTLSLPPWPQPHRRHRSRGSRPYSIETPTQHFVPSMSPLRNVDHRGRFDRRRHVHRQGGQRPQGRTDARHQLLDNGTSAFDNHLQATVSQAAIFPTAKFVANNFSFSGDRSTGDWSAYQCWKTVPVVSSPPTALLRQPMLKREVAAAPSQHYSGANGAWSGITSDPRHRNLACGSRPSAVSDFFQLSTIAEFTCKFSTRFQRLAPCRQPSLTGALVARPRRSTRTPRSFTATWPPTLRCTSLSPHCCAVGATSDDATLNDTWSRQCLH